MSHPKIMSNSLSQEFHLQSTKKHHSEEFKLAALYAFRKGESIKSIYVSKTLVQLKLSNHVSRVKA
jgi:hypothetical protein